MVTRYFESGDSICVLKQTVLLLINRMALCHQSPPEFGTFGAGHLGSLCFVLHGGQGWRPGEDLPLKREEMLVSDACLKVSALALVFAASLVGVYSGWIMQQRGSGEGRGYFFVRCSLDCTYTCTKGKNVA
jgi:hypothetical protein